MKNEELMQSAEKMEQIFEALKEKLPMPNDAAKDAIVNVLINLLSA